MTHILHRSIHAALPTAVSGRGLTIRDTDGREYIDASGGAAVSCLGHGHPDVVAAMRAQMGTLEYAHTSFFTTEVAETLADDLIANAPEGIGHAYFTSGGSEAMEAALKLARQYHVEKGDAQRIRFVARHQSYHGNTLGALAIGGSPRRSEMFSPMLMDVAHIAPCNAYRYRRPDESDAAYGLRAASYLEDKLQELGPETVAAFVAEPIVGATAGAVTAAEGYFQEIRRICDRHGVLLILDEVMCGMGRSGTLHACQRETRPDILTVAKGLGAGYQPIGAVLIGEHIVEALQSDFRNGHTYVSHPIACAAALAVQRVIRCDNLLDNVNRQGERLQAALVSRFGNSDNIGDIRGRGLFRAIEIVADRGTKRPFVKEAGIAGRIKNNAMARGLCVYPGQGTANGRDGDHILIAPPFIVDEQAIEAIVERLGAAVDAALGEVQENRGGTADYEVASRHPVNNRR